MARRIGGEIGLTYLAFDERVGQPVLVRFLPGLLAGTRGVSSGSDESYELALQLLRELTQLQNPLLIGSSTVDIEGDTPYLVRPFVEGKSLRSLHAEQPSIRDQISVIAEVSEAVGKLHQLGRIHGNVHPDNVLILEQGRVRLADFGIGTIVQDVLERSDEPGLTWIPTNEYVAPEQRAGNWSDPRSDLYAIGKLLDYVRPDQSDWYDSNLSNLITGLTQEQPERRVASTDVVVEMLQGFLETVPDIPVGPTHWIPTITGQAQASSQAPQARFVNTWFDAEDDIPPLRVGRSCLFRVNIGAPKSDATEPFTEPDFGGRNDLLLLVTLFSLDFAIDQSVHQLVLPRSGDSEVIETHVTALHEGPCGIEIIISLAKELDVLQILDVLVDAIVADRELAGTGR